jgi:Bacterial regulatory helix-turn-helix protein, lysR family
MRMAHRFAVPLRYWGINPIAHRRREDVTAVTLIVAPKCPYTSDWGSVIAMPYDARLLSGVTVLMAVVEAGSMARAAETLGLTSSGVGRAIGRLETRVGVRLLERTTRTMTLTDEGRRFYEEVGPHLDGIEQAAITASGAAAIVRGRLRVNVDPFFFARGAGRTDFQVSRSPSRSSARTIHAGSCRRSGRRRLRLGTALRRPARRLPYRAQTD